MCVHRVYGRMRGPQSLLSTDSDELYGGKITVVRLVLFTIIDITIIVFIIVNIEVILIMKKAAYNILPPTEEILATMGAQIKLARLRRNLSTELVAERAGISRASLWKVEKGDPSVAMGIYAAVLHALNNMDKDLLLVAKDDILGRELQDMKLLPGRRSSGKKG